MLLWLSLFLAEDFFTAALFGEAPFVGESTPLVEIFCFAVAVAAAAAGDDDLFGEDFFGEGLFGDDLFAENCSFFRRSTDV